MWFSRFLTFFACLHPWPAIAGQVFCPAQIRVLAHEHHMMSSDMFDGPPSDMASLIPENGVWDTKPQDSVTGKYYLVCRYDGGFENTILLSAKISFCELAGTQKNIEITCG